MLESVKSHDWSKTVLQIKKSFPRLTDKNIESLDESIEKLEAVLEKAYNYETKEAHREFEKFKLQLAQSSKTTESTDKEYTTQPGAKKSDSSSAAAQAKHPMNTPTNTMSAQAKNLLRKSLRVLTRRKLSKFFQ